jgi:MFS transporter, putative metabolite:H+ symporter
MGYLALTSVVAGIVFAALSYLVIRETGSDLGWRVMFALVGATSMLAIAVWRVVPESPHWCAVTGDFGRSDQLMSEIERRVSRETGKALPPAVALPEQPQPEETLGIKALLSGSQRNRTLFVWSFWFLQLIAIYGINLWAAKMLVDRGMSIDQSIGLTVIIMTGGIPGTLAAGRLMDRFGRKPVFMAMLLMMAVFAVAYSLAPTVPTIIAAGFLMHGCFLGVATCSYTYTAENFPTSARATGMGSASAVGRVAAVVGPLLVPAVVAVAGYGGAFAVCAALLVATALLVGFVGKETGPLSQSQN